MGEDGVPAGGVTVRGTPNSGTGATDTIHAAPVSMAPMRSSAGAKLSVTGGVTVALDTRGAIDVAAERARLEKDRAAAEKEAAQCRAKLGNPAFVDKAPDAVVAKIRERLAAAEADLARLAAQLESL